MCREASVGCGRITAGYGHIAPAESGARDCVEWGKAAVSDDVSGQLKQLRSVHRVTAA